MHHMHGILRYFHYLHFKIFLKSPIFKRKMWKFLIRQLTMHIVLIFKRKNKKQLLLFFYFNYGLLIVKSKQKVTDKIG